MSEILNKPLTLGQANKRITELEQQLEKYEYLEKWGQYFSMNELKAHNLTQEIKAVSSLAEDLEWLDSKSENNDPPSSVTAKELRVFAKKLKKSRASAKKLKEQE